MAEYKKTPISNVISVDSVVTVFHKEVCRTRHIGESHDFWEIVYVDSGTVEVSVDNKIYTVEEGQIITYAPLAYHIGTRPNAVILDIVSFESTSEAMSFFANKVITLSGKQRQILSQIISIGVKSFKKQINDPQYKGLTPREETDDFTLQSLKNQLELLLIDIYQKNGSTCSKPKSFNYENHSSNTFDALTQYLQSHISETLSLEDICNDCAISLSTLKKVCKSQCGMPPMSYYISLKIDAAKAIICDTDLNFTQISEKLGFSSVHYFSRLFKDRVGISPSEYARSVYKK